MFFNIILVSQNYFENFKIRSTPVSKSADIFIILKKNHVSLKTLKLA